MVGPANNPNVTEIFLGRDIPIDIDSDNLALAHLSALNMYDFLKTYDFPIQSIRFTGSKGYCFVINSQVDHPEQSLEEAATIAEIMTENGFKFDQEVTLDQRRVIRVPGTINGRGVDGKAYACIEVTPDQLQQDFKSFLKTVPYITLASRNHSLQRSQKTNDGSMPFRTTGLGRGGNVTLQDYTSFTQKYITTHIPRTKRQVLFLKFDIFDISTFCLECIQALDKCFFKTSDITNIF